MDGRELFDNREAWRIESACLKLVNLFAHWIDARRYDDLLGLMTDDCMIEWPGNLMRGDELVAMLKGSPDNVVSMHIISTSVFGSVGPDRASCVSYLAFYEGAKSSDGLGELAGAKVLAEYHDSFEYLESGWRISGRVVKPRMMRG
jgi:hypothetical protein